MALIYKRGLTNCSNSSSFSTDQARDIGTDATYATFILSSSTLNLRHFSIVMGSKCKGILGNFVLCTSPVPSCHISYMFVYHFKPRKSMHIILSVIHTILVDNHIRISYFCFLFSWNAVLFRGSTGTVVCLSDTSIYSLSTFTPKISLGHAAGFWPSL